MRIRFHMSYGSVVEHDVPGMNDLGHVVNTLRSRGMLYVDGYKGVIMERHVMYVEEAPLSPKEVHGLYYEDSDSPGGIIGEHYPVEGMKLDPDKGEWT